ncbi:ECF transporter S component [Proteiniborus sp.]|uniref:ECF transporter S component n=1 Tax=Proteiniborus sp. TaxID=2079015 RepID=UPI00333231B6
MKGTDASHDKSNITKLTYCGMLIGLSAVGAMIKISGSIAFDSMPGFFAALFLGPLAGAIVAGLGHLLTALTSGFPLTLPMHLFLVIEMALFAYLFGVIYKKSGGIIASIVAIALNGPISALIVVPLSIILGLPLNGWPLFSVVIIPLTLASAANVLLALFVFKALNMRIK